MKPWLLLTALLAFGCGSPSYSGSGRPVEKRLPLRNFTTVDVSSVFNVEVTQGPEFSVLVTADDNLWEEVDARLDGSTLRLGMRNGGYNNAHLSALVTMPTLDGVSVSGASRCRLVHIDSAAGQLEVRVSGASSLDADARCRQLLLNVAGASIVAFRGQAETIELTVSGASTVRAHDLITERAHVNISGASKADIFATRKLDYAVSGASNLTVAGNPPDRRGDFSGASSVAMQ